MGANNAMLQRVEEIIDSYGCKRESIIAIMQDIQAEYKYLSREDPGKNRGKTRHRCRQGLQRSYFL
jgi:DUF1009 family protein